MSSRVWSDLSFERSGKQVGWLYQPHSVTRSGYGHITTPLAVIKNGEGPTVILMGGNHGDEYEGQVALGSLIRQIDPAEVQGRLIILPQANAPAADAGQRVSPIDQGNLNRAFPGKADGSPTSAIAHFYDSVLFEMADALIDIHSGGTSMNYLPFAALCLSGDQAVDKRARQLLGAFAAPISIVWEAVDHRMSETAAARHGVAAISGEFGGAGTVLPAALNLVDAGIRRALASLGVLNATKAPPAGPTRWMQIPDAACYVFSSKRGVFEPLVSLGQEVKAGDPIGRVHFVDEPLREPEVYRFASTGLVVCLRQPARVERGDCLGHLARDV